MLDVGRHPNIELMAYSEVEEVSGDIGRFSVKVRKKARFVDEDKCTGCGACAEKCPTQVPDAFNEGFAKRSAIYSWFAQGIPSTHTIDPEHCRQLQGKKCGVCKKVCQADAVDYEQKDKVVDLEVGAIVVATGYDVFDPSLIPEYRYQEIDNVITAIELERLLSASGPTGGHLYRPSDFKAKEAVPQLEKSLKKLTKTLERFEKKFQQDSAQFYESFGSGGKEDDPDKVKWAETYEQKKEVSEKLSQYKVMAEKMDVAKRLAFIQCVGSRDIRFYPFCSGYCCMHSIKEAIIANEHEPETTSVIFGMDIRAVGKGFEEYKIRGADHSSISYVRARVAEINELPDKSPVVVYEDTLERRVKEDPFDLVILATACVPNKGTQELAQILGVELDRFGFFKTSQANPVDTTRPGIFVCGCAENPMDIPESVAQASAAAARAAQVMVEKEMKKAS